MLRGEMIWILILLCLVKCFPEKCFSPRGKIFWLKWTGPAFFWSLSCFIMSIALYVHVSLQWLCFRVVTSELRHLDLPYVAFSCICLKQSCTVKVCSFAACSVKTLVLLYIYSSLPLSSFFLFFVHSWSKYVWELHCPAAESSDLQAGSGLGAALGGVG